MAPNAGRREQGDLDVDVGQIGPQERGKERRGEQQQAAHRRRSRLVLVGRRTVVTNDLANLQLAQLADGQRAEQERHHEGGQAGGRPSGR